MEIFCKFSPESTKPSASKPSASGLTVFCFYICGTLSFFNQELLYTASEDILSGRDLPTATVLVCFVVPLLAVKVLAPWFIQRIPYAVKVSFIALTMALGLAVIAFVEEIALKLVGIVLNALASGTAEVTFLGLTSFYPQICISSWVAGTGMASLVSPLYYTAVTTWTCVSPKVAIMITVPFPFLLMMFYAVLDKSNVLSISRRPQERVEVEYTAVGTSDSAEKPASIPERLSFGGNLRIGVKILPFIIPLAFSFFAEYMSNSAVVTTIAFPKSGVMPRDHYLYYALAYRLGKFVGRGYLFIFACLPDEAIEFLKCDKTWIFAVLNNALLIFFVFESWYHFLPYIWIMIALCSILGIVAGMIVLHSPHAVARRVLPEEKEFALGLLTVGNAVGAFVAGFAGLAVEPFLTAECKQHFPATSGYCFTRVSSTSGWDTNIHCS